MGGGGGGGGGGAGGGGAGAPIAEPAEDDPSDVWLPMLPFWTSLMLVSSSRMRSSSVDCRFLLSCSLEERSRRSVEFSDSTLW